MKKFQHKIIARDYPMGTSDIQDYGYKGWELCSHSVPTQYYANFMYIFKREIDKKGLD